MMDASTLDVCRSNISSASSLSSGFRVSPISYAQHKHMHTSLHGPQGQVRKPRQPSKEQWEEELKPLIQYMYTKEDKRLRDVLQLLRRKYNFLVTFVPCISSSELLLSLDLQANTFIAKNNSLRNSRNGNSGRMPLGRKGRLWFWKVSLQQSWSRGSVVGRSPPPDLSVGRKR
jgi:hypothetical protein